MPDFHAKMKNNLRTEAQGADTVVWLAMSDAAGKHLSGLFFQGEETLFFYLVNSSHLRIYYSTHEATVFSYVRDHRIKRKYFERHIKFWCHVLLRHTEWQFTCWHLWSRRKCARSCGIVSGMKPGNSWTGFKFIRIRNQSWLRNQGAVIQLQTMVYLGH